MDTSKEYIKMCDKSGLKECCSYVAPNYSAEIKNFGDNVFVELDRSTTTWRTVRLLRQSQIQEMIGIKDTSLLIYKFNNFCYRDSITNLMEGGSYLVFRFPISTSMEQLWLAFYMWEKHKKIWDGEKWTKTDL